MAGNIWFLIKQSWHIDKLLPAATLVQMPVLVLIPFLTTWLSKSIVQLLSKGASPGSLIKEILLTSGGLLALQLAGSTTASYLEHKSMGSRFHHVTTSCRKAMDMDYENLESPQGQTRMQKAFNANMNFQSGTQQIFKQLAAIASNTIGLILYSLFIFRLGLWLAILLIFMNLISYYTKRANNAWWHRSKDEWVPLDRKREYVINEGENFGAAKDIRLYKMDGWFHDIFQKLMRERMSWTRKIELRELALQLVSSLMLLIRDCASYGFLIYSVVKNQMTAADFVLYFGLISQYSNYLTGIIDALSQLNRTALDAGDLREFLDIPDHFNRREGIRLPEGPLEITFDKVSFRYPESPEDTLKNISFTLHKGEKTALVGLNGAGKTTIVKLLCGLYRPTCGTVLINGNDLQDYNRDDYYTLLSAVFQDICLLPASIAKNVALCQQDKIDRQRLDNALKLSGLYEKVQELPMGTETPLVKGVVENAVEFSGGQIQKIALARALYKGGQAIVLDEPTAALDPIAENEMYQKYSQLTDGATSLFISHRLSSTRFCDKIIFLEKGSITEEGSHQELMSLGGKYASLFEVQSHYYKESVQ